MIMSRRKIRISELYVIFYDRDLDVVDRLEEVVERTGCKKREVIIKALKQYFELNAKD